MKCHGMSWSWIPGMGLGVEFPSTPSQDITFIMTLDFVIVRVVYYIFKIE